MFISSTVNCFLDPKSMSLKNKTALITGASSGIGEACAYALKEEGARLILTGRNKMKLQELAKKMDASFIVADLQDDSEVEKLFNEAGTSIDILVNYLSLRNQKIIKTVQLLLLVFLHITIFVYCLDWIKTAGGYLMPATGLPRIITIASIPICCLLSILYCINAAGMLFTKLSTNDKN